MLPGPESIEGKSKAFFVPLTFLSFITTLGQGTEEQRQSITDTISEMRKSKEFQEKLFDLSTYVTEKFGVSFLMVPRYIEVSSQDSHKDIISKFIGYLGSDTDMDSPSNKKKLFAQEDLNEDLDNA